MSAKPSFEKAIREIAAPVLRQDGFKGSGQTFRHVVNGVICVLNFQRFSFGGQFAINLGLHPCVLPDMDEKAPDPRKILEYKCEFRQRLRPDRYDMWWPYHDDESLNAAMEDAIELYKTVGREKFASQTNLNSDLFTINCAQIPDRHYRFSGFHTLGSMVRMAHALALMRLSAGQYREAEAFAKMALQHIEVETPWTEKIIALIEYIQLKQQASAS